MVLKKRSMFKKIRHFVFLIVLPGLGGEVYAGAWEGKYSTAWSDERNWLGGEPTVLRGATIPKGVTYDPVITETGEVLGARSYIQADGHLTITSGDLTCFSRLYVGGRQPAAGPGTLTVTGGTIDIPSGTSDPGRLSVSDEAPGTVNMFGGEISVTLDGGEGIKWPDGSGEGRINMHGGVIRTSDVRWKDRRGCIMTFYGTADYPHGGKLIVRGDRTAPEPNYPELNIHISMTDKYLTYRHYFDPNCLVDPNCDPNDPNNFSRGIITTIPSDRISITYDADEDVTIVESVPNPCGLYQDDVVDCQDLQVLAEKWLHLVGADSPDSKIDFNRDGMINMADFAFLAAEWLGSCPKL